MKKLIASVIGVLLFASLSFAEPVYTETKSYQVEVLEDGQIQVREATRVFKDGEEIAKTYHRKVLAPGDNTDKEVKKVKDIAKAVWTPEVIIEYEASKVKPE